VYEEQLESLSGSVLWPRNLFQWLSAWSRHFRVEMQLSSYETFLKLRAMMGYKQMDLGVKDSFRE
jgi:hypothetical protein